MLGAAPSGPADPIGRALRRLSEAFALFGGLVLVAIMLLEVASISLRGFLGVARTAVAGDGGTGVGRGRTKVISQRSRTPRSTRWSWSSRHASLGAGGHLNGASQTPITAWPSSNRGTAPARCSAPGTE